MQKKLGGLRRPVRTAHLWVVGLSLAWGAFVIGRGPLNPFNTDWLHVGDLSSAQTNLMYFRQTSWLQWPVTALPNYGVEWGTLFNESGVVPLGLITKVLNPVLPMGFQYFGYWALACFVLQGLVAHRLLTRLRVEGVALWAGISLFLLVPVLSFRIQQLGHHDLIAHWLILLAFDQYFDARFRKWHLSALLLLALSVNAYIFALVFVVVLIKSILHVLRERYLLRARKMLWTCSAIFIPSLVAYSAYGYLSLGNGIVGSGFFRLNGLAFVSRTYLGEDFAYLGAGVLMVLPCVIYLVITNPRDLLRGHVTLLAVGIVLFLVALSPRVAVGSWQITYPVPEVFETVRQVFRVANRLSWLLYYHLILLAILALNSLRVRYPVVAGVVGIVAVSLQLTDQVTLIGGSQFGALQRVEWNVLQDGRWDGWATSVNEVVVYPTFDVQASPDSAGSAILIETGDFLDILWWTARHNLPVNLAYRSRPVPEVVADQNSRLSSQLAVREFNEHALYIIPFRDDWRPLVPDIPPTMDTRFVDGLYVIFPSEQVSP